MSRKLLLLVSLVFSCSLNGLAQNESHLQKRVPIEVDRMMPPIEPGYKLYPTNNFWVFLKLNTGTGSVNLVQFSVESSKERFQTFPVYPEGRDESFEILPGRYELIPTKNNWTFILIDRFLGYLWQVNWSTDGKPVTIQPIR